MSADVFADPPIGSPGSPADLASADPIHTRSATLQAPTLPGLFVTRGTSPKTAALLSDDDDVLEGLVVKSEHLAFPSQVDADGIIQAGVTVGLARTGRRCVYVPGVFGPGLPVYVRITADTEGPVGSIQSTSDGAKTRLVPPGAIEWITAGEDEVGVIELNLSLDADAGAADS